MEAKYDLIVVGGGFAGVASAIQAAKSNLNVLLIEKYMNILKWTIIILYSIIETER